jgi:hypothetical protein
MCIYLELLMQITHDRRIQIYNHKAVFSSHGMQNTKCQLLWNDEIQNAKIFMVVFSFIQNAKFFMG